MAEGAIPAPGPVREQSVGEPSLKHSSVILKLVQQPAQVFGVHGPPGHHVHPLVEVVFDFAGEGVFQVIADQEKALRFNHVEAGSALLPLIFQSIIYRSNNAEVSKDGML